MSDKTILVTESDGKYKIENKGFSDLELIGTLECVLFDLKSKSRLETETKPQSSEPLEKTNPEKTKPDVKVEAPDAGSPDIKTRIKNAVTAIKNLGGETVAMDLDKMSDAELEVEFEELSNQYRRLNKNKGITKK